jgi:hypothetical protein
VGNRSVIFANVADAVGRGFADRIPRGKCRVEVKIKFSSFVKMPEAKSIKRRV